MAVVLHDAAGRRRPSGASPEGALEMRESVAYAILAGLAWGAGGYLEKWGLQKGGLPPLTAIAVRTAIACVLLTLAAVPGARLVRPRADAQAWILIAVGGGLVAGSLGMWAFYSSLATTTNLGVSLAIAFALSPVAGTLAGAWRGDQPLDLRTLLGLLAIVLGIVLVQSARHGTARP
jgi:drug/metabolite transporter (DMT)-like permease